MTANFVGTCRRQSNQQTQLQEACVASLAPGSAPAPASCLLLLLLPPAPALTFVELSNVAAHGVGCCVGAGGRGQEAGGRRHAALALTALLANVEVTNFGLPAEIVAVSLTHSTPQLKLKIPQTTLDTVVGRGGGGSVCPA